jgi:hypothetical protein
LTRGIPPTLALVFSGFNLYLPYSLVGTGNIDKAIICDIGGTTIWANTPGFSVRLDIPPQHPKQDYTPAATYATSISGM